MSSASSLPARSVYQHISIDGQPIVHLGDVHTFYQSLDNDGFSRNKTLEDKVAIVQRALYYASMDDRKSQIEKARPQTLEWIWSTEFPQWLADGSKSLFWISGKPASGKSTLMKYLNSNSNTSKFLAETGNDWTRIHFYFDFNAGRGIANSRLGMIRSMLVQLVKQIPQAAHLIYRENEYRLTGNFPNLMDELEETLQAVIETSSKQICAFIDGLDEFDGNLTDLVRYIMQLSKLQRIKICVASRPETPILALLKAFPHIVMQEWNSSVIYKYFEIAASGLLEQETHKQLNTVIVPQVQNRAKGVILWATYAIDEIVQGAADGLGLRELADRLDNMPPRLEAVYERLLNKIPEKQKVEAAVLLTLIGQTTEGKATVDARALFRWLAHADILMLDLVFLLWQTGLREIDHEQSCYDISLTQFRLRVYAMLRGFVGFSADNRFIRRFHKTLHEYLLRTNWTEAHIPSFLRNRPRQCLAAVLAASTVLEAANFIPHSEHETVVKSFDLDEYHRCTDRVKQTHTLEEYLATVFRKGKWHANPQTLVRAIRFLSVNIAELNDNYDDTDVRNAFKQVMNCWLSRFLPIRIANFRHGSDFLVASADASYTDVATLTYKSQSLFVALHFGADHYFSETLSEIKHLISAEELDILFRHAWLLGVLHRELRAGIRCFLNNVTIERHHLSIFLLGGFIDIYETDEIPAWFSQLSSRPAYRESFKYPSFILEKFSTRETPLSRICPNPIHNWIVLGCRTYFECQSLLDKIIALGFNVHGGCSHFDNTMHALKALSRGVVSSPVWKAKLLLHRGLRFHVEERHGLFTVDSLASERGSFRIPQCCTVGKELSDVIYEYIAQTRKNLQIEP